ncbi:EAL domain-containing protein [Acidithiobacillus sp. IBUN Pt1247-S3]|uniref:EAL domain-containing protein n=1 Tax=Acidithiobacillus sp. IBUN Pt1247-S3 TaxID=3166642 RepID=UPI0034E39804
MRSPVPEEVDGIAFRKEPIFSLVEEQEIGREWLLDHALPDVISGWVPVLASLSGYLRAPMVRDGFLFVNGNSDQLGNSTLRHLFASLARQCRDAGIRLVLEWTESLPYHAETMDVLCGLRQSCGTQIAVDDGGSVGLDVLWRMTRIPPDWLKIDGAWFHLAEKEEWAAETLYQTLCAAKNLGVRTVIEWIETPGQLRFARDLGAEFGQGFYWKNQRVIPADTVREVGK